MDPVTPTEPKGTMIKRDFAAEWKARCMAEHAAEVARGEHDSECEYGRSVSITFLMLCHCSKRKRERGGFATPPEDDLEFPPPSCPRCHGDLDHDEDWSCHSCSLSWELNGRGHTCRFTDDYGVLAGASSDGLAAATTEALHVP
jgi:hypothetical protein